jgi:hypothetical protein
LDTLIIFDPVVVIRKHVYVFVFLIEQGLNAFTSRKKKPKETTKKEKKDVINNI